MKNVSNYYHDKVPIWNGGGAGGYFEQHNRTDDVTSTVGWWDEQTMVSYGDDILFQYFTFELLILPLTKLIIAVFSTLQRHVI